MTTLQKQCACVYVYVYVVCTNDSVKLTRLMALDLIKKNHFFGCSCRKEYN